MIMIMIMIIIIIIIVVVIIIIIIIIIITPELVIVNLQERHFKFVLLELVSVRGI